jgi:hypothetical protein
VQDQPQQTSAQPASEKYDPTNWNLNQTSSLANKSFASETASLSQKNTSFKQSSYLVKPYGGLTGADHAMSNLNSKFPTSASSAYSRNATELDKTFTPFSSDSVEGRPALFAASASGFQDRTAALNGHTENMFASPLADKSYQKIPIVQREINDTNAGDLHLKDLPDRPLTIDEVRALINHGIQPDTTVKPAPPSKPLNDPDYQPEPSPPPPDGPAPASEDDKNDPVPPPGTLAQPPPENSESLPQH